ncbi:MarR family winged helix-turn-helix transcriptional regulator [Fodinibius salsisoli]|uniref:MarR family transcriptional regulator n=1 Tax=Fodinibius salsisoli TaxID=2820877 RepID=A0ABT3PI79_9BACT|nr:MarR family transcriptional regulator [Fodinibius salsisoli]MCW9705458.1 MarR family transcriptional regulator [Fodinibius salsisoli]
MEGKNTTVLSENIYFLTSALSRKLSGQADEAFATLGLSSSHALILVLVDNEPGVRPSQLAQKLYLKPSTITRLVQKLERRELVTKEAEGREKSIVCTSKGEELAVEVEKTWQQLLKQKEAELGERYVAVLSEMISKAIEEV